jgi:glycosyltransferase involved in cell wall biosynthesis
VFTGVLSYHPNADAALFLVDEVLPRLRRAVPDVRVEIVGRDPAQALRERAKSDPALSVTGFVPDLRPHLETAAVAVAPVRYGAGVQNKVLEAMAMELPVVATPFVAGGLRAPGGEEAPLAVGDGPDAFADRVAQLLRNPQAARELGQAGRRFVEQHHVWARSAEILEMLCKDAVKARER